MREGSGDGSLPCYGSCAAPPRTGALILGISTTCIIVVLPRRRQASDRYLGARPRPAGASLGKAGFDALLNRELSLPKYVLGRRGREVLDRSTESGLVVPEESDRRVAAVAQQAPDSSVLLVRVVHREPTIRTGDLAAYGASAGNYQLTTRTWYEILTAWPQGSARP